jgi:predicted dehydrogenase
VRQRRVGVVVNGVTGRMGYRQHLTRSLLALRDQGGVPLRDGTFAVPEPILVGRDAAKLQAIAQRHGIARWTTDLSEALAGERDEIYFDAQITEARAESVKTAIAAGKHVYAEKPLAESVDAALDLAHLARQAGVRTGVVQDKLFLPGIVKLRRLLDAGFFGQVLSVRGEFGYWVFEGDWQPSQRPSWNYRAEAGGGITLDMFCHWSYLLEQLFAPVTAVTAVTRTHIPQRWDEQSRPYQATADDAAYAVFELADGTIAQINSSWATRVNRDELVEFLVDGTDGSAVAGLHRCKVQPRVITPMAAWDPDTPVATSFREQWQQVPDGVAVENAFKTQWIAFLRHVCEDGPFPHDFVSGARGVQLAEAGLRSSAEGRRIVLEPLAAERS